MPGLPPVSDRGVCHHFQKKILQKKRADPGTLRFPDRLFFSGFSKRKKVVHLARART
jgi:hypothetical protein